MEKLPPRDFAHLGTWDFMFFREARLNGTRPTLQAGMLWKAGPKCKPHRVRAGQKGASKTDTGNFLQFAIGNHHF